MKSAFFALAAATVSIAAAGVAPLRRHDRRAETQQKNPSPIISTLNGLWFDVEVKIGDQSFYLLVDTGSSDTWVAKTGYLCISKNNTELAQEECAWSPTFDAPEDLSYVKNQTFGVRYGTGIALGKVAIENVTLGGITVPDQKIGVVDRTNDIGDGLNSGILGLGYPALTSAHYGANNSNDSIALITNRAVYDPLFVNMYKKKLVDSWYSVALDRPNATTSAGGWLGLGELPSVLYSDDWAVAPVEITKNIPDEYYSDGKPEISLMTLTVDSVTWGKRQASKSSLKTNSTKFQAVVDTGNSANMLPADLAEEINASFNPPAKFSEDYGVYVVECNATAPKLGVTIANQTFWHEAVDLVQKDASTGLCYSLITPSAEGEGLSVNFLGDPFLRNVVAVFDFGKDEMRFAARTENTTDKSVPTSATSGASILGSDSVWGSVMALGLVTNAIAFL